MTNSTPTFARSIVIALAWLVAIAVVGLLLVHFLYRFLLGFLFHSGIELEYREFFETLANYFFSAVALIIILACLYGFYLYLVNKVEAARGETGRARLKLAFAAMGLLVVLTFAFSEYSEHQERPVILDICAQFSQASRQEDYETAYEFLSPNYRRSHSLEEFIKSGGRGVSGCNRDVRQSMAVLHWWRGVATVTERAMGTVYVEIYFERVGGQWYIKGESFTYQF